MSKPAAHGFGHEDQARISWRASSIRNAETKVYKRWQALLRGKDFPKAARMFELARKAEPLDSKWSSSWPGSTNQSGESHNQINVLRQLGPTDGR